MIGDGWGCRSQWHSICPVLGATRKRVSPPPCIKTCCEHAAVAAVRSWLRTKDRTSQPPTQWRSPVSQLRFPNPLPEVVRADDMEKGWVYRLGVGTSFPIHSSPCCSVGRVMSTRSRSKVVSLVRTQLAFRSSQVRPSPCPCVGWSHLEAHSAAWAQDCRFSLKFPTHSGAV